MQSICGRIHYWEPFPNIGEKHAYVRLEHVIPQSRHFKWWVYDQDEGARYQNGDCNSEPRGWKEGTVIYSQIGTFGMPGMKQPVDSKRYKFGWIIRSMYVQGSAIRWDLGSVIPASWPPLTAGARFTQPRAHLLADPSLYVIYIYQNKFLRDEPEIDQ